MMLTRPTVIVCIVPPSCWILTVSRLSNVAYTPLVVLDGAIVAKSTNVRSMTVRKKLIRSPESLNDLFPRAIA